MAEGIYLLNACDTMAATRYMLREMAGAKDEWAGIPLPIDGVNLIVEPSYRFADIMNARPDSDDDDTVPRFNLRNIFWSWRWRCDIAIWDEGGTLHWGKIPRGNSLTESLNTLEASVAWGIEQEHNALQTLGTMLSHPVFKQYLLTGSFLETSERSGLTYMFRKLRPTVVLSPHNPDDRMRILCALCLHPIAYYADSWAGAMCPTDDVIAHLALMRGDEHMFWKRANQHMAYRPEAGI